MDLETYEVRAVRQVVMAEGWQAVYWNDKEHCHWAAPLYALGLGTTNIHVCRSNAIVPGDGYTPEEKWEMFGLEYTLGDGWNIAQEANNFCGLLPPDRTLEDWNEHGVCACRHPKVSASEKEPSDGAL